MISTRIAVHLARFEGPTRGRAKVRGPPSLGNRRVTRHVRKFRGFPRYTGTMSLASTVRSDSGGYPLLRAARALSPGRSTLRVAVVPDSLGRGRISTFGGMSLIDGQAGPGSAGSGPALSRRIEAMVTQWSGVIQKAARQYGLSTADLDEVTQDVRLRLWSLLERDGDATAVNASYAWRAASSAAIDLVRRVRLSRAGTTVDIDQVPQPRAPEDHDLLGLLQEALDQLQRSRRIAVRLHLDGSSLQEIATVLGWSQAQARNQVYRGLADLKRILTPDGAPGR